MKYLKKATGILLFIIGLFGFYFFRSYTGNSIPYPIIWQIISFILLLAGGIVFYFDSSKKEAQIISTKYEEMLALKSKGEKIVLDYDQCEFTNTGFTHEVEDKEYSWMGGRVMFAHEITKQETVYQSGLIYNRKTINGIEKFYSPSFPFDKKTLEFYVLDKKIILYIDRFNRGNYVFEVDN